MREIADQHERALVTARDRIGDLEAKLERGGGGGGDDASAASDASTDAKVPELQKKLRVAAATVKKLRARETELEEALKAATGGEGGDDAAKAAEAEAAEARTRLDEKAAEVESLSDALEAERESSRSLKLALEEQTAATKTAATAATTAAMKELDAERATSSELRAKTQEMAQIIEQLNDALAESHAAEEDARAAEEVRDAMAEQNESALRADVANLTSEARPRSITLVPIPPRSRGERRSLRTLLPGASISPPRVPRWFQSRHTATPFNSASDAFQLHPDVIARTDPRPEARERKRGTSRAGGEDRRDGEQGASLTLVPIRPRSRGERRSLRTLSSVSLRPPLAFNARHRCLSTPTDAFQLYPDVASNDRASRRSKRRTPRTRRSSSARSRRRWRSARRGTRRAARTRRELRRWRRRSRRIRRRTTRPRRR
jgi:chemotaxis protein histidine kinase CheA